MGNTISQNNLEITPSVTVHDLLEAYPQMEEVLIGIAPPFEKLKNPFLRRSVAKVATIKHIASVGGVPLDALIAELRDAVGQPVSDESFAEQDYFGEIIELVTSFLPAPGIDILKAKGYKVWTVKESEDLIRSYFLKSVKG